jgi:hypothetical protein
MKYPLPGGFFDRTMRAFVRVGSPARALSVFLKAYENNPKAPQSQTVYLALEIAATFNAHNTATKIWTQVCIFWRVRIHPLKVCGTFQNINRGYFFIRTHDDAERNRLGYFH